MSNTFVYMKLSICLITEQLGTCTEASIWNKHVQERAKKDIAAANKLAGKLSKSLEKYKGVDFPETKEVQELKGILRAYMQLTGSSHELPDSVESLIELSLKIKEEFDAAISDEKEGMVSVFMKDKDGWPIISSHMILGNLKENLRNSVNNGDKEIAKSKVSVGEMGALDIKVVEDFLRPSKDIMRTETGERFILERPIKFERMGKVETAISRSEVLPAGTEYTCTLRIRALSPLADITALKKLLDMGKNNGLGQWRGSGKKGTYCYKLEKLDSFQEPGVPEGWS